MDTMTIHCQGINDVQETKGHSNPNSYRTSGMNFAFSFNSLKLGGNRKRKIELFLCLFHTGEMETGTAAVFYGGMNGNSFFLRTSMC